MAGFPVSSISLHDIILSWLGLVKCPGETGERDFMYWRGAVHSLHLVFTLENERIA